jgi:hypothetical protein
MSDPTPSTPDRDRSAPQPGTVTGKGGVPQETVEQKDKGVAAGLFGTVGCLGVTFAGGVFIAAAVLAFVLIRGCADDDQPSPGTPPEPLDPTEVRETSPAPPGQGPSNPSPTP